MRFLQHIEFFVRSIGQILLVYLSGGPRREAIPDWRARPYRILFVRDDGIGDLILSMELLRAIRDASPGFTIDLLGSPQNAAFARTLPFLTDVVVHRRRGGLHEAWRTGRLLRRRRYDVVVDGRGILSNVDTHTTLLLLGTGARWRIGIGGRRNDRVYTIKVDPAAPSSIGEQLAVLAQPFGVDPHQRDWRARLPVSPAERAAAERAWTAVGVGRPRVLVNISVGHPERYWRHERYAPVLARLRARLPNATIMLTAMPHEQAVADDLARPVRGAAIPLTFSEVVATVATADLVITPDTAITHVASAFQTPTLALMRRNTHAWVPFQTPGKIAFGDVARRLEPGLTAERVVAVLDELITEMGPAKGWL
ncbi:MAG: glycosyltransferase family 9 protein [Gemmatimonadaceae bacterium]